MAPKKKEAHVEPKQVKEEPKVSFIEEMQTKQAIIAAQNTDKAHKDILIKNIKELEKHQADSRKELTNLSQELETKMLALKHVDDEIKAQSFTMERQNQKFEKENSEKLRIFEKKQADLEVASKEYATLLQTVREKERTLQVDLGKIADERTAHKNEMNRLTKHVQDVESADSKLRADILVREQALKDSLDEFETEKEAMKPDMKRISEIKNENGLLWQKIEEGQRALDAQKASFDSHKVKIASDVDEGKANIKRQQEQINAQEGKLRQWEQDLKDIELELKVREEEAQKMMKRYQLQEKAGK